LVEVATLDMTNALSNARASTNARVKTGEVYDFAAPRDSRTVVATVRVVAADGRTVDATVGC
jgi:hypothetical protein